MRHETLEGKTSQVDGGHPNDINGVSDFRGRQRSAAESLLHECVIRFCPPKFGPVGQEDRLHIFSSDGTEPRARKQYTRFCRKHARARAGGRCWSHRLVPQSHRTRWSVREKIPFSFRLTGRYVNRNLREYGTEDWEPESWPLSRIQLEAERPRLQKHRYKVYKL
ncbi:hypothetical protein TGVAND_216415 [Toxoplasma gondii VAND]|uniref:Uncharacterized protein n=3 Tax=Toxoplasma gondii TaxID=5811 RepID=A0A086Q275_TOXGO|nr:hypothetical protein TGP89_216415 [Toxoplasma gondii p89]KFH01161.1 hypothetical protein TGVAND_216415 [Toxoplasma gondii VAND]KFH06707.1 hypothetical protein TGMAS_216415 [Toxoplasma gondii MAS]